MSPLTDLFTKTPAEQKQQQALSLSEQKAKLISLVSAEKHTRHGNTETPDPMWPLYEEAARIKQQDLQNTPVPRSSENFGEKGIRGVINAGKTVPLSIFGVAAGAGAVAESAFGKGGFSTQFKEDMAKVHSGIAEGMAKGSRPEDSFTYSYGKAKDGDWGALGDWVAYNMPNVVTQLGTIIAGAGIIQAGTQLAGKKAVNKIMGGVVKKETDRIMQLATKAGQEISEAGAAKLALSNVTKKVGQIAGMGAMSFGLSGGEIMGDLAQQTVERGEKLTGKEIAKGLTATGLAGAVEYMETVLGLKAFTGKLGKIPGLKGANEISGIKGKAFRGGVTAGKMAPAEFAQEYTQTGIEQWGTGETDLMSEQNKAERLDAGMAGALIGPAAGAGSTFSKSNHEQRKAQIKQQEKDIANAEIQHGYKEKVSKAAETGDVSKFTNPQNPDFNPIAAMEAKKERSQKKDLKPLEKLTNYDEAVELYSAIEDQKTAIKTEMDELKQKEDLTDAEVERQVFLLERHKALNEVAKKTGPMLMSMKESKTAAPELIEKMKTVMKEQDSDAVSEVIFDVFGSTGGMAFIQETDSTVLDDLLKNESLTEPQRNLIQSLKAEKDIRAEYTRRIDKSPDAVHADILDGNAEEGFMGVTDHHQGIGIALANKDGKQAQKRLEKLQEWAGQKQARATTFRKVLDAVTTNKALDPDTQAAFDAIQAKRVSETDHKGNPLKPYNVGKAFEPTIENMELEAQVLTQAVATGQAMVDTFNKQTSVAAKQSVDTPGKGKVAETPKSSLSPSESPASPRQQPTPQSSANQNSGKAVPNAEDALKKEIAGYAKQLNQEMAKPKRDEKVIQGIRSKMTKAQEKLLKVKAAPAQTTTQPKKQTAAKADPQVQKKMAGQSIAGLNQSIKNRKAKVASKKVSPEALESIKAEIAVAEKLIKEKTKMTEPLKEIGFNEAELNDFSKQPAEVQELLKHKDSTIEQLKEAQGKAKEGSPRHALIKKAIVAKKRLKPKTESASIQLDEPDQQDLTDQFLDDTLGKNRDKEPTETKPRLVFNEKTGRVEVDGKSGVTVNSLEELVSLGKEFEAIMVKRGLTSADTNLTKWAAGVLADIKKWGLPFEPVQVVFKPDLKNAKGVLLGQANENTVRFNTSADYHKNRDAKRMTPLAVWLHEYVHVLTARHLDNYPDLQKQTKALMEHVLKQDATKDTAYAFTDAKEFLAQAISSQPFQEYLNTLPPLKADQSLLQTIKELFASLVQRLTTDNPTALTDTLKLVQTVAMGDPVQQENTQTQEQNDSPLPPNKIGLTFTQKVMKKGLVPLMQKTNNILYALKSGMFASYKKYFNADNAFNEQTQAAIDSIVKYGESFQQALDGDQTAKDIQGIFEAFEGKGLNYRDNDPIQYLVGTDGKLTPKVVNALMAVSYKYLATRASETVTNDAKKIRKILGLKDDQAINAYAQQLLKDKGVTSTMLHEQLGQDVFQLLGIKAEDTADNDLQNKLEISLGLQAIATMEHMGHLTMTKVHRGTKEGEEPGNSVSGFQGLVNSQTSKNTGQFKGLQDRFELSKDKNGVWESPIGEGAIDFYRVATSVDPETGRDKISNKIEKDIATPFQHSKTTWDLIFNGQVDKKNYSWKPLTYKEATEFILKKTGFKATKEQTKNLIDSINKPCVASGRSMNFFLFLDQANREKVMGYQDLTKAHKINQDSVDGVNFSLDQTQQKIMNWLADAKQQKNGYASEFFIPAEFWRQGRMGQIGDINLQGNKPHRFLFNMKEWEASFDPKDIDAYYAFMEAVGLALDIEVSKEGGLRQAVEKTEDLLQEPVFQKAIKAVQDLIAEVGDLDTINPEKMAELQIQHKDKMALIADATKEGGMNVHSMKGIIEYARYLTAAKTNQESFTTDLPTEIDGVSNGPIIGRIQLMGATAKLLEVMTALQNGGIKFHGDTAALAEHLAGALNHDAYQAVGFAWSNALAQMETDLIKRNSPNLKNDLTQLNALKNLFGDFREKDGTIGKIVRKLSKDPTMKTVYGMQEKTLLAELGDTAITKIYTQMEEIAASGDLQALQQLAKDVGDLTRDHNIFAAAMKEGKVDSAKLLQIELTPKQTETIKSFTAEYHGKALSSAIKKVYGDMQETFAPLNTGINLAAGMYNTIYKLKLKQLRAEIDDSDTPERKITVGEFKQMEADLQAMFPHVTTPMGGQIPLAKFSREKEYAKKKDRVVQSYQKGTLPQKKGAPYKKEGLEAPGVAGTILTIHDLDSIIANRTLGLEWAHILNNHDGFTTNILSAKKLGEALNQHFYETMRDYDMGMELYRGTEETHQEFNRFLTEIRKSRFLTPKEINDTLVAEFKAVKIDRFTNEAGKTKFIDTGNYKTAIDKLLHHMKDTGVETKKNKDALIDSMVAIEQYSYPGAEYQTGNKAQFKKDQITEEATAKLSAEDKLAKEQTIQINQFLKNIGLRGSDANPNLVVDPADYVLEQEINSLNVLDTYNRIKNDSSKIDNAEHDQHLQHLVKDIFQLVMQPVDMFMKTDAYTKAHGFFMPDPNNKGKILLSNQPAAQVSGALNVGIRMSTGEVYTHELVHSIVEAGLRLMPGLANKVSVLYNLARNRLGPDGYKLFLNDPTIDVTDQANQFEVQAAKERYEYIFGQSKVIPVTSKNAATGIESTHNYSAHLDEFLAFALTNQNFRKALADIKLADTKYAKTTWTDIKGENIQSTLLNIARKIFQFFSGKFASYSPKENMALELERLAFRLGQADTKNKTQMFEQAKKKYSSVQQHISDMANGVIKGAFTNTPVLRIANDLRNLGNAMRESDTSLGKSWRGIRHRMQAMDQNIIKSAVQEGIGRTDRLGDLYTLINRRHMYLDTAKQTASDTFQEVAQKLFKRKLTDSESTGVTKILLQTDAAALFSSLGSKKLQQVLEDSQALDTEISTIVDKITKDPDLGQYATFYRKASDALGHFMVHGQRRNNEEVFQSTQLIAEMQGTKEAGKVTGKAVIRAEALVDQLASLYATQYTSKAQRAEIASLMAEDHKGVTGVLAMHQTLKEEALVSSFNGSKYLFRKGYTKEITNPRIQIVYGTLANEAKYKELSYTRSLYPVSRDPHDPTGHQDIFMYTAKTGRPNNYVSTVASLTGNRAAGTTPRQIAQQLDLTTAQGRKNNAEIIKKKQADIAAMFDANINPTPVKKGAHMLPQFDWNGNIVTYRYMMSENVKDSHLEKVNDFTAILGGMAGQIVDKARTPQINRELVSALKDMYDKEYKENPNAYVEIGPHAVDPHHREIYHILPDDTKTYIRKLWGNNTGTMYVAKDVVDLAFGYRQYSIIEAFTKDPKERAMLERIVVKAFNMVLPPGMGIVAANNVEQLAMELARLAKNNIIVKSLVVTLSNLGSNMMYLKARGIPTGQILKLGWEAIAMGTKYQADTKKLNELQAKKKILQQRKKATNTIDNEIMQLENAIARNPVRESIESGLMPALVDDIQTSLNKSYFPGKIEQITDKQMAKLHPSIQTVGKVAFLTQDTQAYKVLNNAVKMHDFIGRHVLYNYYIKTKKMDKAKAVDKALEEFTHFQIPTHRMTEYFNQIGMLWFTKYGIRILKSIKTSVMDKPFEVAMSIFMASHLGMDTIYNSVPFVTSDPFNKLSNPLSMAWDSADMPATIALTETILNR